MITPVSFLFIVLHGLESADFRVDQTTIILLMVAFLPFTATYLEGIKAGNYELYFRSLSTEEKLIAFLKALQKERLGLYTSKHENTKNI